MGGSAFSTPGPDGPALQTPRLSNNTYNQLKVRFSDLLQGLFLKVRTPHETPGKLDHGDIDFLVEGPRHDVTHNQLCTHLKARRSISNGPTSSFAVTISSDEETTYAQVDVHVCDPGTLEWTFIMHSYGDLFQLMGVGHKGLGITINDNGLHIRLAEMESVNRKSSMLFMTDSYVKIFEFLGLDCAEYDAGFRTEEAIFTWVARGRFFDPDTKKNETANDRHRKKTRPMFRRFIDEWLPTHPEIGASRRQWTREEIMEKAINTFNMQDAYEKKLSAFKAVQVENQLWSEIADVIPLEGQPLNLAIRGLKRWVGFNGDNPFIRRNPVLSLECTSWTTQGLSKDDILQWVKQNWVSVNNKEKKRVKDQKHNR